MQMGEGDQKDPPSFRMYSLERISAAADGPEENSTIEAEEQDDEDDGLEFSFMQIPESGSTIAADDIFSNGKILPVYPVFNRNLIQEKQKNGEEGSISRHVPLRRLFVEEEREQASFSSSSSASSSSSSHHQELDGIPPETYCVWNANQDKHLRCKKSNSMGSKPSSLRWRLKDLVVGRSKSDGKEKFVFIPMIEKPTENPEKVGKDGSVRGRLGMKESTPTPREVQTMKMRTRYGNNGQDVGKPAGRKSYLPYKRNLLGLFNANGLSTSQDSS